MKIAKEIVLRGLQGMGIGVLLIYTMVFIFVLVFGQSQLINSIFFIKQYIAGAGIGFVFGALNLLFQIDKMGIIEATIVHFIGICIIFFPTGYFAGWIGEDAMTITQSIIILIVSYFFIWFICYLGWKKEINNINRCLENNLFKQSDSK